MTSHFEAGNGNGNASEEEMIEHEHEEGELILLTETSPEAVKVYNVLKDTPELSDDQFRAKIEEYNFKHRDNAPAEGPNKSFTLPVGDKRELVVTIYDNGRVVLAGTL